MNITFLIGNGFDLRVGMKTKYTDMYDGYINSPTIDATIADFKEDLASSAPKYETWSDFEMGMAEYAQRFDNEDDFIKCIRDFKAYMIKHLCTEEDNFFNAFNKSIVDESAILEEFEHSIANFYKNQIPNVKNRIKDIIKLNGWIKHINFITFNYTKTLEFIKDRFELFHELGSSDLRIEQIVHIHGDLDNDVVLGVDNKEQIKNLKFNIDRKVERAFIKPRFNHYYDEVRVQSAKDIIENSDVICIYGLSLGESDLTWSKSVANWLLESSAKQLIYFAYGTNKFDSWNVDARMDEEDEVKNSLLKRLHLLESEAEKIYDQIHVPVGENIFDIEKFLGYEHNIEILRIAEECAAKA